MLFRTRRRRFILTIDDDGDDSVSSSQKSQDNMMLINSTSKGHPSLHQVSKLVTPQKVNRIGRYASRSWLTAFL